MKWILNPKIDKRKFMTISLLSVIVLSAGASLTFSLLSSNRLAAVVIGGTALLLALCSAFITTIIFALLFGVIDLREDLFVRRNGSK